MMEKESLIVAPSLRLQTFAGQAIAATTAANIVEQHAKGKSQSAVFISSQTAATCGPTEAP